MDSLKFTANFMCKFISLVAVLVIACFSHAFPLRAPLEKCERTLVGAPLEDRKTALEILNRALEKTVTGKARPEARLRDAALTEFGLEGLTPAALRGVRVKLGGTSVSLIVPGGQTVYKRDLNLNLASHIFDRRQLNGRAPEVTISDEISILLDTIAEDTHTFISFRNLRGNRFLVTLGMNVPCHRRSEFRGLTAHDAVHVFTADKMFCQVAVLTVNAK